MKQCARTIILSKLEAHLGSCESVKNLVGIGSVSAELCKFLSGSAQELNMLIFNYALAFWWSTYENLSALEKDVVG